jgi:hypothetical protein
MRRLTTLIADTFVRRHFTPPEPPPPVAAVVRERINRVLRRRLSDRVTDVFYEACVGGDLEAASELLAVLEAMHARRQAAMPDRRIGNAEIVQARETLNERKAEHAAAPARTEATELGA